MKNYIPPYERILAENSVSPYEAMRECIRTFWQSSYKQLSSRPNLTFAGIIPNPAIVHVYNKYGLSSVVEAIIG